jgi:hypothetical protein
VDALWRTHTRHLFPSSRDSANTSAPSSRNNATMSAPLYSIGSVTIARLPKSHPATVRSFQIDLTRAKSAGQPLRPAGATRNQGHGKEIEKIYAEALRDGSPKGRPSTHISPGSVTGCAGGSGKRRRDRSAPGS